MLVALPGFLNPDEAGTLMVASNPTLSAVIREAHGTPYPAFYLIFLHFWRLLGTSNFVLRLPSIIASTAALWFAFRWLVVTFNRTTGLTGLILLAFAPTPVALFTEVGPSSFVLLFAAAGLLLLELAFQRKSALTMASSGLLFVLALASHPSAVWLLASLGLYGIIRVILERPPRAVTTTWAAGQVVIALLAVYGCVTQLLPGCAGAGGTFAHASWLGNSYFQPGEESVLFFPVRQTTTFFQYIFASLPDGIVAVLLFVIGFIILLVRGTCRNEGKPKHRDLGLLLLLPFCVACLAAMARFHPYGGSRYDTVLLLPAMAGVAFAIADVSGRRAWPVLAAAVMLVPVWIAGATPASDRFLPANQRRVLMDSTVTYLKGNVPTGRLIFSDMPTQFELRQYLCNGANEPTPAPSSRFLEYDCNGMRLVTTWGFYDFPADGFGDEFTRMAEAYGLEPGDTVCVASVDPSVPLSLRLFRSYRLQPPELKTFGGSMSVFQLPVGREPSQANQAREAEHVNREFLGFIRTIAAQSPPELAAVFWPTALLADSLRDSAATLAPLVLSYGELYELVHDGNRVDGYLPGLAFWYLRSTEWQPEFMSYMNDAQNYISGKYRFTLALMSPDSTAAVYFVQLTDEQARPMPAR